MAYKLGREKRRIRNSKETPIFRKNLDKGILGEANMDGSVFVDNSVNLDSKEGKKVIAHELEHIKQMEEGAAYGDDWVRWKGETHPRGDGYITYKGKKYKEGSDELPWEKRAKKAE